MAIIENAATPEAYAAWLAAMEKMTPSELCAQQLVQRGAEHALQTLIETKSDNTLAVATAMLDSIRNGLLAVHEVAHRRHIPLPDYSYTPEEGSGAWEP